MGRDEANPGGTPGCGTGVPDASRRVSRRNRPYRSCLPTLPRFRPGPESARPPVPRSRWRSSAGRRVGDQQIPRAAVPIGPLLQIFVQVFAQQRHRRAVIQMQEYRAGEFGPTARPVLVRLAVEVGHRHRQPAVVPDPHRQEREGDLLDGAHFPFHHNGVADLHRIAERDLQAGHQVAQRRLRGHTGDDADHTGRGQQRGAERAQAGKQQQDRHRGRGHHQHRGDDAPHQRELGAQLPHPGHITGALGVAAQRVVGHRVGGPDHQPHRGHDGHRGQHIADHRVLA